MEIDKNNHRVFYEMCKTIATDEELSKKMLSLGYSYIKMEMVYENGVCVDSTETVFRKYSHTIILFKTETHSAFIRLDKYSWSEHIHSLQSLDIGYDDPLFVKLIEDINIVLRKNKIKNVLEDE